MNLQDARERLAGKRGREYWRTLEELADTPEFRLRLESEFPSAAEPGSRREFLGLMAASLALAGVTGCSRPPPETIVPYVRQPEDAVPGRPLYFATASLLGGVALGVLAESHLGRPTKVEGNPGHPASLGATHPFAQASVLGLYDPDRSQVVSRAGRISTASAFLGALTAAVDARRAAGGRGLRVLSEAVTSPSLARELGELLRELPEARWHAYEPWGREAARGGALLAFGQDVACRYRFEDADVVLSLDADFLFPGPAGVRYIRDFTSRRRAEEGRRSPNRLYVVETAPSATGAAADHRWPLAPSQVAAFARSVAARLRGARAPGPLPDAVTDAIARDLSSRPGGGLVLAGDGQPPEVHALAHAMNHALGSEGRTVEYTEPVEVPADPLPALVDDLRAGRVELLVILGGNPAYTAPADLEFGDALGKARLRVRLGLYEDETSKLCHWHVPEAHELESWGDARAFDGTVTFLQPLIAPLYGGRTALELVSALRGRPRRSGYEILREHWKSRWGDEDFERRWQTALHDGLVTGTRFPARKVALRDVPAGKGEAHEGLEVAIRPDPTVGDGRFSNNAWLQELPKPMTLLTWDNAALMGPATAGRLGLSSGDVVELRRGGRSVRAPVWVLPGHADGAVTLHLGYGRTRAGRVGTGAGFDASPLRTPGTLELRKTGERATLASTQHHHLLRGRDIIRSATVEEERRNPDFARREPHAGGDLYPAWPAEGPAWGMVIDLNACTGCNACVVGCQAENNVPVVGKGEVLRGREMHWIRVDHYRAGPPENPETYLQPMLCVHCEKAPCEPVCPVGATTHSAEGINEMTYNRCVGTRYCSNNCPWKVRRFNFFPYADAKSPSLKLQRNPDVTVRGRGVMEKCTYCVQRISLARIEAKKEGRPILDGEVQTACQQACPARAIVFGDLGDPESRVARLKSSRLNYAALGALNTRPRTTYLARVRNPNPEIDGA